VERLGQKTMKTFTEYKIDPVEAQGTADTKELGKRVKESLFEYLQSGPVVAMVVEGIHAIDMVRKLAGNTLPVFADMGTIRGDYSVDSPAVANVEGRAIHNIMHASETVEEATNEINLWFKPEEIHDYKRAEEDIMF
jgi:nucleoside-diphosphate kinase